MFFKKKKEKTPKTSNRKVVPNMKPIEELRTNKDVAEWCRDFLRITDELSPELAIADRTERNYLMALVGLLVEWFPRKDLSLKSLAALLSIADARENDEDFKSALDLIFVQIEKGKTYRYVAEYHQYLWVPSKFKRNSDGVKPADCGGLSADEDFALMNYKNFKVAAGKTLKSILISCGARLAPFDIKELRDLMEYDELELDTLGDQKTALFVILSDTDSTFNFVAALMYSQLFNLLCDKADDFYGGRLPVHVRLILDEFANIGQIPNFDKLIATIRSREISASIILQSQSQLKTIYKDAADTIVGNCDSTLFLGGKEKSTLKEISELLGKETIDLYNQSENRGSQVSHGLSYQKLGKELMTQDELAVMDGGKCIFMLRGVRPFLSDKYDLTRHPNYRYTADADPKNVFDMERYMKKQRAVVKPTDTFDVYEIDATT